MILVAPKRHEVCHRRQRKLSRDRLAYLLRVLVSQSLLDLVEAHCLARVQHLREK